METLRIFQFWDLSNSKRKNGIKLLWRFETARTKLPETHLISTHVLPFNMGTGADEYVWFRPMHRFPKNATFWKMIWKVCERSHRTFWEVLKTEGQAISWNFWLNGKLKKGHHIRSIFTGYSRPRQKTQFPLKQKTAQHQLSFRTNRLTSSWWEEASRNQLRQIQNQRPWWWEVL